MIIKNKLSLFSVDYFKETDSEGKEAVHSAIQRLQRDPDRDVRFFAGVDEDALDLAFQEHFTSSHDAAPEYNFQDACSTPLEEFALEHEMPKNAGSDSVGDVQENVSDNIEIITETLDRVEQPVDSDHTSLDEGSLEAGSVEGTVDTNAVDEFEEDERRLDDELKDAVTAADDIHVEEEATVESVATERCTDETAQAASDTVLHFLNSLN